jgi:hypothetical protein
VPREAKRSVLSFSVEHIKNTLMKALRMTGSMKDVPNAIALAMLLTTLTFGYIMTTSQLMTGS